MSIKAVTYYQAVCDWPGCDANAHDGGEYTAYGTADEAGYDVEDAEWWVDTKVAEVWYCNDHPAVWASDHEGGEPFPEPPYLLIHDGDTDSATDDGQVTLVEPASEATP